MSNAERILQCLDNRLEQTIDLTLYGRAAQFIWQEAGWSVEDVRAIFEKAQIPAIPELAAEFERCKARLLSC